MRIGLDFDGVLCQTPFGRLAVHKPSTVADLPDGYAALYDHPGANNPLRLAVEYLRFGWRAAAPGALALVRDLSAAHQLFIVTGRSKAGESLLRRWLRGRGIESCVTGVQMAPEGLRPAQHKLATARMLGIEAHIDDDPRTAFHLATNGVERVFLLGHAGALGDATLPPNVVLVRSLGEFAEAVSDDH